MNRDYSNLSREELEIRLDAAEDVCAAFGWMSARSDTEREIVAFELWRDWHALEVASNDTANNRHMNRELKNALVRRYNARCEAMRSKIAEA